MGNHAVLYADDTHLRWAFESFARLEGCISEARTAFKVLQNFNLKVNFEKTKAILKVVGSQQDKVRKAYVRCQEQTSRLLLSPKDPSSWISLVPQTEYLGLIISYGSV